MAHMEIKDDYLVYVFVFTGWEDGLVAEFHVGRRNYELSGYCKYRIKRHDIQDIFFFCWQVYHELSLSRSVPFANAVLIVIVMMIVLFVLIFVVVIIIVLIIVLIWL